MTDLAKDFRAQLARARRGRSAGDRDRPRWPPMARASGCCRAATTRPSRWCTSPRKTAARCASPRRWAARSIARSARPRSRASTAISRPRKSSARCGSRIAELGWQVGRRSHHHQHRVHGHGRAAREFPQRGARRSAFFSTISGFDISRRRVTLSTSGLVPQIYKLAEEVNVRAGGVAARARTTSCAASSCPSTASTRSPSCWRPAGTTSTSRTAAA